MRRGLVVIGIATGLLSSAPAMARGGGPDAAACAPGAAGSALRVRVHGFEERDGSVRVSTYRATEAEWLVRGKYVRRIDIPVPASGDLEVCVALPGTGRYAVGVLHDRNSDGKLNPFRDGFGVSNNPRLGLSKPKVERVAFAAGAGVTPIAIKVSR